VSTSVITICHCANSSKKNHDPKPLSAQGAVQQKDYDYMFKIMLFGDSGVGKSSLLLRFTENAFTESFVSTIGVDFKMHSMDTDQGRVKLQLWDTAGQERFRAVANSYYRGAHGIVIVYDTTERESFDNIDNWLSQIHQYAAEDVVKMLVGNKVDLEDQRKVSTKEGVALADKHKMKFYECSAKSSANVGCVFTDMAKEILSSVSQKKD